MKAIPRNVLLMRFIWTYFAICFKWVHVLGEVDSNCDHHYQVRYGEKHVLESPNFHRGGIYEWGKRSRWFYEGPTGSILYMSCDTMNISASNRCYHDRFMVSRSGSPTLADAQIYCGDSNVQLTSVSNYLTVGLISAPYSRGGRYRCYITPVELTRPQRYAGDQGRRGIRKIVGGVETDINEFPFMASIVSIERRLQICGASIISDRYALTVAHCVVMESNGSALLVGDHNVLESNETDSAALYPIEHFIRHEEYHRKTHENDIALVKTIRTIVFGPKVQRICLPFGFRNYNFSGAPVIALGWGRISYFGPTSDYLQKVNLTVITQEACQERYPREEIFSSNVCTYAVRKDSCKADSGGPIIWMNDQVYSDQKYQLIGLVSYGTFCAITATVNTRVTSFLDWISRQTLDAKHCQPDIKFLFD